MKNYTSPVAKEVELDLCDVILTSELAQDLGEIVGGVAQWLGDLWHN